MVVISAQKSCFYCHILRYLCQSTGNWRVRLQREAKSNLIKSKTELPALLTQQLWLPFARKPGLEILLFPVIVAMSDATHTNQAALHCGQRTCFLEQKVLKMLNTRRFWMAGNLIVRKIFPEYFHNNMAPFNVLSSIPRRKNYACAHSPTNSPNFIRHDTACSTAGQRREWNDSNRREISTEKRFWIWV